jgi:hypothetical protein
MGRKATGPPGSGWIAGLPTKNFNSYALPNGQTMGNYGTESHGSRFCGIAGLPLKTLVRKKHQAKPWATMGRKATGPGFLQDSRVTSLYAKPWVTMGRKATGPAFCGIAGMPVLYR